MRGGKRPGAGRKKGSINKATQIQKLAREMLLEMIQKELKPIVQGLIKNAKGYQEQRVRLDKDGNELMETIVINPDKDAGKYLIDQVAGKAPVKLDIDQTISEVTTLDEIEGDV